LYLVKNLPTLWLTLNKSAYLIQKRVADFAVFGLEWISFALFRYAFWRYKFWRYKFWQTRRVSMDEFKQGKGQAAELEMRSLNYEGTYRCPACGSGDLQAIAMMDVFACNFCRHLFTANLQTQSLHMADSLHPRAWQWTGGRWRLAYQSETAAALVWVFSAFLAIAPVFLIALSNYIFPPLEGSDFPLLWIGLTLLSHALIAGWLLAEYHRWPWYISSQIRWQRWLSREAA
jgi:ribosomal protein L37AE/L43A